MLVCSCLDIDFDIIKEAVKEHGDDIETISEETGAGKACECCLEYDCEQVEIPLPKAIKKALKNLES